MEKFKPYAFSFLGGALYALGFPSALGKSLLITPIIGLALLLFQLFRSSSLKIKAIHTILFCLSFNITGFYWI
ncbi:MAG: hypothetical protein KC478_14230, partial [Bacteriovoracaceae bacterium]|nr:hypothetical protein [Bacteriovoracaceae bacterium]